MTEPAEWERLQALFEATIALPPEHRAAFLAEHVNGDSAIRREVESLVAAHEAAGRFLHEPALPGLVDGLAAGDRAPLLTPGTRLGAFEIVDPLGAGGMGEVYRARDTRLDRFVAIKVLSPELAATV